MKVITAQSEMVPLSTGYLATLRSRNASTLQPLVEGDITKIFVNAGQRVEAGAPILEIDPRKQQATVNNQEAALKVQTGGDAAGRDRPGPQEEAFCRRGEPQG